MRVKYTKYTLWIVLLFTQSVLSLLTEATPAITIIGILGTIAAITSAEGWYWSNIVFIIYALGPALIAWQANLYGDLAAMLLSSSGSIVALFTWRHSLKSRKVRTRKMNRAQWLAIIVGGLMVLACVCVMLLCINSAYPILNAIVLTAVILAEILFLLRYCETYTIDLLGDAALFVIWCLSGNWILAFTVLVDITFAIYGLINWQKLCRKGK